jgi:hypothetical protein
MYCTLAKPIMRQKSAHVNGFLGFASGLRLWASLLGFDCSMEAPYPQRLRLIARQWVSRPTPWWLAPSGRHSVT